MVISSLVCELEVECGWMLGLDTLMVIRRPVLLYLTEFLAYDLSSSEFSPDNPRTCVRPKLETRRYVFDHYTHYLRPAH